MYLNTQKKNYLTTQNLKTKIINVTPHMQTTQELRVRYIVAW